MNSQAPRILVIRRDNIGDLLCTTPLIHGLRKKFPTAYLSVLASNYNAAVLEGNPDIDEVFIFLKRHQKVSGQHFLSLLWKRWKLVRKIRKCRFDYIFLANGGWRYARSLGGKKMIGFRERHQPDHRQPNVIVPIENDGRNEHEVSKMARLGAALEATASNGPTFIFPDLARVARENKRLSLLGWNREKPSIALHISSRQPHQRWTNESFVMLAKKLISKFHVQILLFWSPGKENNRMHPGDDEKAECILRELRSPLVFPCPTQELSDLAAGLSLADQMICSDGGAMHVAAALKKPIVCFFGESNVAEWHPWKVPSIVVQAPSKIVADISVEEAFEAFSELQKKL
ncbi:MAG: glycosyltransferase family 9 protein [Chthoniobacterales bacterium]